MTASCRPRRSLIRPDGIVAWAASPCLPAGTAALATALRTWLGEPRTRMANGQQGEPGQPAGRKSTGQRRGEV
ncbi:aromatic-ring hydroxylase C-terminal domain-containing protein [Streptomyces sp. NPDC004044]